MTHRLDQIKPESLITRQDCQDLIDEAIRKHNRNAGLISMVVGWFVLGLFADGVLRLTGSIPPLLPWLRITLN